MVLLEQMCISSIYVKILVAMISIERPNHNIAMHGLVKSTRFFIRNRFIRSIHV